MLGRLLATALLSAVLAEKPIPNVFFVVVDDLAPVNTGYGWPVKAPNMERLAERGVQFRNSYVSIAVCGPSRTAFLTGLRPDTTQVWTIGPYFRNTSRGEGMQVTTLPQLFRQHGYNTTGAGKIFHPGVYSGGIVSSQGGGDQCPSLSPVNDCPRRPRTDEPGSWTEPYWFCDQFTNDTVQSPSMGEFPCSLHGEGRSENATYTWPSCGGGCVQPPSCITCFEQCGTWGKGGSWDACDCPDTCYPEGLIADQTIRILEDHAAHPERGPWFHAMGLKRPHLSYRAPARFFDMYDLDNISLPLHPEPSPSAPPISYSHSCQVSTHTSSTPEELAQYGTVMFQDVDANVCTKLTQNTTSSQLKYFEVNQDVQSVKELRRAYYAVVTFMDSQLGRALDTLKSTGLDKNTIVTFIGDHGYQNGQKGEWCKSNNFELATRIPTYVVVPESFGTSVRRGVVETTIVESLDLMPTLADLAGLPLPKQALGGETMRGLLLEGSDAVRQKTYALSQWARRPSCTERHGCEDGHGDPSQPVTDQAYMGYALRTDAWRYIAWFTFDYNTTAPHFDTIVARELYDHEGDIGDEASGESYEWDNLADSPEHQHTVDTLHTQLVAEVKKWLVKPILP